MKYGAHVFVWGYLTTDDQHYRVLDSCARMGLSFLEISVGDDISLDMPALGRRARSMGIDLITSPGGVWPMDCDLSLADPADRRKGIDWHKQALDLSQQCGAIAYAGAAYGRPGQVDYGDGDPDEPKRVADGLRELGDYGAQMGVRLLIEPMSHFRTHVANTPRQINELIRLADCANISSVLDTFHMCTEVTDFAAAVNELIPHLWYIHACENTRGAPGEGLLPWDAIAGALVGGGWDGLVGFETYNSSWDDGRFARSRGMFHNVCPDADAFIRQAKTFMEAKFAEALAASDAT